MVQPYSQKPLYSLFGKIVHGRGIGKLVGAPTANLQILSQDSLPPIGVYIAEITLEGQVYHGVTNIGTRPTVDNDKDISVETFIIDFHRDIYGKEMGVHLFKKLRNPQKFCDFSMLLEQIRQDCIAAQDFFGVNSTISQLHMSIEKHQATINGQPIYQSRKEFDVLYLLYSNPDIASKKNRYMKRFGTKYLPVISTLLKIQCFKFEESAKRMEIAKVLSGRLSGMGISLIQVDGYLYVYVILQFK